MLESSGPMPVGRMAAELLKKIASLGLFACVSKPLSKNKAKKIKNSKAAAPKRRPDGTKRRLQHQQQPPEPPQSVVFDSEFNDKYTVEDVIGRGGFGTVYAGYRNTDHKPVAIKVARKDKSLGWIEDEDGKLIPREVWCLQRVQHISGIIPLIDFYDKRSYSTYVLVMERPDRCQDLFDYISERGTLTESEARDFMLQVVQTLVDIHAAGVIHRDVKDENILVDLDSRRLRLVDFGSATKLKQSAFTDFDGTLVYSSPEWLLHRRYNAEPYTVWTLGILLYDMVCGNIPFKSSDGIIQASPSLPDTLSPEVQSLICRCLSAEPDQRPTLEQILTDPWMVAAPAIPADIDCTQSSSVIPVEDQLEEHLEQPLPSLPQQQQQQDSVSPADLDLKLLMLLQGDQLSTCDDELTSDKLPTELTVVSLPTLVLVK